MGFFGGGQVEREVKMGEPIPAWINKYNQRLQKNNIDLPTEIEKLANMKQDDLNRYLGGKISELPYEILGVLLIGGSEDEKVAELLRSKRERYLLNHPEMSRGVPGAGEGVITFDGRFIPKSKWITATDSEKRAAMVGTTCFHFNSETPGMGSGINDRW